MNKMIHPRCSQLLAAIALLIFGTTARLHAVEALLLQDAYVDNKNNSNLGSNGNLRVTKSGNQVCRSFLKFSLATLPAGITATNVTEARLRLWVDSSSNTLGSITMTPVTSGWDEFTITNTTSGGLILSSPKLSNLHRPELRRNFRESGCSIEQLPFRTSRLALLLTRCPGAAARPSAKYETTPWVPAKTIELLSCSSTKPAIDPGTLRSGSNETL
jgi:hypothetical protein